MSSIRKENILRAYRHEKPYFVPSINDVENYFFGGDPTPARYGPYRDEWGVQYRFLEGQPGPVHDESVPHVVSDITKWREQVAFPTLDHIDWKHEEEVGKRWDSEHKLSNVILINALWEGFYSLCGLQDALCNILMEPEASYELLDALCEHALMRIRRIAEVYHPEKVQMHDDYGMERTLFFAEDLWRELIKPHLKRITDECHRLGMLYEHHSCGYIAPLIDDFVELGIDAWNPVQSSNNPKLLFEKYAGKLTFVGGFNDRLFIDVSASEEEKLASIRDTVERGAACGTWIPRPASGITEYTGPIEWAVYEHNRPIYERMKLSGPGFEPPEQSKTGSFYTFRSDL